MRASGKSRPISTNVQAAITSQKKAYQDESDAVAHLLANRNAMNAADLAAAAATERARLGAFLDNSSALPSLATVAGDIESARAAGLVIPPALLDRLATLQKSIDQLAIARDALRAVAKSLEPSQSIPVLTGANSTLSGNVTCIDDPTQKPWDQDVPVTIDFEELPRWNAAVGLLVSSLGRLQYDLVPTNPHQVPATSTTPASFAADTIIGQKARSPVQLVPFTLVNFRTGDFVKWNKQFTWGPAFGIGVNPNNGDTQAEYFEGAYLAIGPVSFFAGIHNGRRQRIQSPFYPNEVVDTAILTVPLTHVWWNQPAIGISYQLPLH